MARVSYISRIRTRITELEAGIKEMQGELDELRVAERVIGRLGADDSDEAAPAARFLKPRTVGDAILEVLGANGPLESREIFEKVKELQETTSNTISTTLSRLKEQGLVALDGRLWSQAASKAAVGGWITAPIWPELKESEPGP